MSCKVGDKVVVEIGEESEFWGRKGYDLTNIEPLSTYTEPLEAKIKNLKKKLKKWVEKGVNQRAEITRLLEENKRLKAENGNSLWNIEQARAEGAESAWELARKIAVIPKNGGYGGSKLIEIFNTALIDEILNLTYPFAAAKVAEWEKAKEEIKVGDVFEFTSGGKAVVMKVYEDGEVALFFPDGGCGIYEPDESWHKTGRHIDIDSFLKQIGGN